MYSAESLEELINDRLTTAAAEIFGAFKNIIYEYEEEIVRQRRLLDVVWKPEIKLPRIDLPVPHVNKEEERVAADPHLCNQEGKSTTDYEGPEAPQMKNEQEENWVSQEGENLLLREETDAIMVTPTFEENDQMDDETLCLNPDEPLSTAQEVSVVNLPVIISVMGAPNSDRLLSNNSHVSESRDQTPLSETCENVNFESNIPSKVNADEKPYVCRVCGKYFSRYCKFAVHKQTVHTDEEPYRCKICGKGFTDDNTLTAHLRNHPIRYTCKTCGKFFRYYGVLACHLRRAHLVKEPYLCKTCGQTFTFSRTLKDHKIIHTGERPYACQTCGKGFKTGRALSDHMRIHTGEKPYICETCGKGFARCCNLIVHRRRAHTGEKPYRCKICEKSFTVGETLRIHMRIHTGERPYSCQTCGKNFKRKGELSDHVRIHTGERPYVCQTCGKDFKTKSVLSDHIKIHTKEKPYTCETCGKDFRTRGEVTAHRRTHTGERPFICKTCGKRFRRCYHLTLHTRKLHNSKNMYLCKTSGSKDCDTNLQSII